MAPARDHSLLLRAGVPSSAFSPLAALLERTATRAGWPAAQLGIAGVGIVYSRWSVAGVTPSAVAEALAAVRTEVIQLGGYIVVEEAPPKLAGAIDIWGPPPEGSELMGALRATWDPAGILNPGRVGWAASGKVADPPGRS
jgi:FAD/FMN-containing dehydrogenase